MGYQRDHKTNPRRATDSGRYTSATYHCKFAYEGYYTNFIVSLIKTIVWIALALGCILQVDTAQAYTIYYENEDITEPVWPQWATGEWIDFAAHIVAGETRSVPSANRIVACTLIRDIESGWQPWSLRKRWYGWKTPTDQERRSVIEALNGCLDIPVYRFVGSPSDLTLWQSRGMVGDGPFDMYTGFSNHVIIGVRYGQ